MLLRAGMAMEIRKSQGVELQSEVRRTSVETGDGVVQVTPWPTHAARTHACAWEGTTARGCRNGGVQGSCAWWSLGLSPSYSLSPQRLPLLAGERRAPLGLSQSRNPIWMARCARCFSSSVGMEESPSMRAYVCTTRASLSQ